MNDIIKGKSNYCRETIFNCGATVYFVSFVSTNLQKAKQECYIEAIMMVKIKGKTIFYMVIEARLEKMMSRGTHLNSRFYCSSCIIFYLLYSLFYYVVYYILYYLHCILHYIIIIKQPYRIKKETNNYFICLYLFAYCVIVIKQWSY